jgi:hypothetical protein
MFHIDDLSLIGRPENPVAFPIEYVFEVGGQTLVISGEPVQASADPANATMRRRLDVIPPVSLRFVSDVQLFAPGAARPVTVELAAARAGVAGTVQLEGPAGWRITAASQPFHLAGAGERARFTFTVTAPAQLATAILEGSVRRRLTSACWISDSAMVWVSNLELPRIWSAGCSQRIGPATMEEQHRRSADAPQVPLIGVPNRCHPGRGHTSRRAFRLRIALD